jgi:1-acyl-sn-glycerol-3-phosphate acyltransferase
MCAWLFYTLTVLFVAWAIFATRMVNDWFSRKYIHLAGHQVQNDPLYKGFHRNDFQNWNRLHMTMGAIFLLPVRLLTLLFLMVFTMIYSKILARIFKIKNFESEFSDAFTFYFRTVVRVLSRVCLFALGYHRINVIRKPLKSSYTKFEGVKQENISIIISNHVSLPDMLYFATRSNKISFAAKEVIKEMPIVGFFSKIMQCVFINRSFAGSKKEALISMQDRADKLKAGKSYPSLVVFPEGTVTNGRSLIDFKHGAFSLGVPLKIVGLKYSGNFNPCLNLISDLDCLLGLFMQPSNELTVVEIAELIQPKDKNMTPNEFASAVREMMCEEFGLENTPSTFQNYIDFNKKYGTLVDSDFK